MFDPKSDYALNKKDPSAIVYIDAFGTLTRLTPADFSDPEKFQRWKAWSDESYHQIENAGIAFYKHTLCPCMACLKRPMPSNRRRTR